MSGREIFFAGIFVACLTAGCALKSDNSVENGESVYGAAQHNATADSNGQDLAPPGQMVARPGLNPARVRDGDPDWKFAQKEVYANQSTLEAKIADLPKGWIADSVIRKGRPDEPNVTLTFDDGPHPQFTLKLLQILRANNVKATFFVIGFMADRYPDLVKAIAADGHTIGNHSYSHVTLSKLPEDQLLTELKAQKDVVYRLTGQSPRFARPPGGDFNQATLKAVAALGMKTVLWTDDPADYSNPGDQVLFNREMNALRPGAIILLHDGSQNTVDTLDKFIKAVKKRGLNFVTLDAIDPNSKSNGSR